MPDYQRDDTPERAPLELVTSPAGLVAWGRRGQRGNWEDVGDDPSMNAVRVPFLGWFIFF